MNPIAVITRPSEAARTPNSTGPAKCSCCIRAEGHTIGRVPGSQSCGCVQQNDWVRACTSGGDQLQPPRTQSPPVRSAYEA
jgi:hypothetical protein